MDKKQAHFEAFGYEPLRMKPAHFASGFFMALNDEIYANELLNKVAVTKANKGLLEGYAPEEVLARLRKDKLIADTMTQADVELLRIQVNGASTTTPLCIRRSDPTGRRATTTLSFRRAC